MKNLYKKISAALLVGALLVGNSLANVSMIHANSNNLIDRGPILDRYMNEMKKLDSDLFKRYDKMGDNIEDAANRLKPKYNFKNFYYVAAPGYNIEMLCEEALQKELNKYCPIEDSYRSFESPEELVKFMLGNLIYRDKPYLVRVGDNNGYYKFIIMVK